MLAWHFVNSTLRNGDPVPADGVPLIFTGPLRLCASGLHASVDPFDALQYAPGAILCRVECDEIGEEEKNKFVCRKRTILCRKDASEMLRYFARMQALSVVHLYHNPPDVVLDYLMTGDESIRAAAWDAARAAAWDAARAEARDDFNDLVRELFWDCDD